MNNNIIKKTRFLPLWKEDKEMNWLKSMAKDGWHLVRKGFLTYYFEKGESEDCVFIYDYKPKRDKSFSDFVNMYESKGWMYVAGNSGWHYFKAQCDVEKTNCEEAINFRKFRLRRILFVLFVIAFSNAFIVLYNILIYMTIVKDIFKMPIILLVMWGFSAFVVLLLLATAIKVSVRIHKLDKKLYEYKENKKPLI